MSHPPDHPPDLSSLSITDSTSSPNPWASQSASAAPAEGEATPSGSFWSSQEPQFKAIPKLDTDEFDPFAPNRSRSDTPTLGSTVKPGSRLELLPAEDDDQPDSPPDGNAQEANLDWANTKPSSAPKRTPSTSPKSGRPKALPLISGSGREGSASGSGFLGMFRSRSGGGSPRPPVAPLRIPNTSQAEHEKGMLESELSEKGAHAQAGGSNPVVTSQAEGGAGPSNPLNSIANVFRQATSRNGSTSGTPLSGTSPTEKAAYLEMARSGSAEGVSGAEQHQGRPGAKGKEVEHAPVEAVFDFNKFLEQMRQRSADPIAKYLRSFLKEFSRKPPASTADQVKVINDFLDFIAGKMRAVDPWRAVLAEQGPEAGEAEFDMALEAMEKLVMNRLWHLTFTPALDLSAAPGQMSPTGDIERDQVLSQRIRLFSWISPRHLDLPIPDPTAPPQAELSPSTSRTATPQSEHPPISTPASEDGTNPDTPPPFVSPKRGKSKNKERQAQNFLDFARRELIKMNQYKAPRDKLICILNSCKVIFGLMRHVAADEGADAFIPFLIYVVLQANPEHLVSNIQYIQRFRNPDKLTGEGGYYLSSLGAAISFIESLDHSSLSHISKEEFEANVAEAIAALPIDPNDDSVRLPKTPTPTRTTFDPNDAPAGEAGDEQSPAVLDQPGMGPASREGLSFPESTKAFLLKGTDSVERAMAKPIGAIGALFDQLEGALTGDTPQAPGAGRPGPARRRSQLVEPPRRGTGQGQGQGQGVDLGMFAREGMTARQVTEEIDRQHEQQRLAALNTLKSIFPTVENEVLEMVLLANSEDMARTIDALLEMAG